MNKAELAKKIKAKICLKEDIKKAEDEINEKTDKQLYQELSIYALNKNELLSVLYLYSSEFKEKYGNILTSSQKGYIDKTIKEATEIFKKKYNFNNFLKISIGLGSLNIRTDNPTEFEERFSEEIERLHIMYKSRPGDNRVDIRSSIPLIEKIDLNLLLNARIGIR